MQTYEHKQFSPLALLSLVPAGIAFARYGFQGPRRNARLAALAATGVCSIPFTKLTTRVDERGVSWAFGFGFPRGSISFDDIAAVQMTQTRMMEGFGIHWTLRHGWLWNVAGWDAVMIRKTNGRAVTLGSDDAQGLYDAIRSHVSS
jgi:hypothetical protein